MRLAFLVSVFLVLASLSAGAATLSTDGNLYQSGDKIHVSFNDPDGHDGAWIGLFYASVPTDEFTDADAYDLDYAYTQGQISGIVELDARQTGFFQVRFIVRIGDIDVAIASSATFEVSSEGARIGEPSLAFEKLIHMRGADVRLSFTFNPSLPDGAWIGIFERNVRLDGSVNPDSHDKAYSYVKNRTSGVWDFKAPMKVGYYSAAIISGDKNEWVPYTRIHFQVTLDGMTPLPVADDRHPLALSRMRLMAGEELIVAYKAPGTIGSGAWLGLIPASVTALDEGTNDRSDLSYKYVDPGERWYWTIHVPANPGFYVIRLFPSGENSAIAINPGAYFEVVPRTDGEGDTEDW